MSHPSTSPPSAKGSLYAHTLDSARRQSLSVSPYPALAKGQLNTQAVNSLARAARTGGGGGGGRGGGPEQAPSPTQGAMDWTELLRKFNKHNPSRPLTAATALLDHHLHVALLRASHSLPSPSIPDLLSAPPSFSLPPLPFPILPADHALLQTQVAQLQTQLDSGVPATEAERNSAMVVLGWARYAMGDAEGALRTLQGTKGEIGSKGQGGEGYDVVLKVVGSAVQALALESLSPPPAEVLPAYLHAANLYVSAVDSLASSGGKEDIDLHRVGGEALYRACLLSRESSPTDALHLHTLYLRLSSLFLSTHPASHHTLAFPAAHRLLIHRSLRLLRSPSHSPIPAAVTLANNTAQERLVRQYTVVPKAGETNKGYLRFLEECVEGWREGGMGREEGEGLVEILYSALTHTIQSHLLLRHLLHVLASLPSPSSPPSPHHRSALKILRLYRAYGLKTRETDAKEVVREMKRLRRKAAGLEGEGGGLERQEGKGAVVGPVRGAGGGEKTGEVEGEKEKEKERVEEEVREKFDLTDGEEDDSTDPFAFDLDSDAVFLRTLAFGVRLLVKQFGKEGAKEAVEVAGEMRGVWKKSKDVEVREGGEAERWVEWAEGVAEGALAEKAPNPATLATLRSSSLSHLRHAASLSPSSFSFAYSLAYTLLQHRLIPAALNAAKNAVSLSKRGTTGRKEAWHLLALAVSAGKDMRGALEVVETALDEEEVEVEHELDLEREKGDQGEGRWLNPTDEIDSLEASVQLRLTKQALVEYLEGSSAALEESQETLAFFAREVAVIHPSTSVGGAPSPSPSPSAANVTSAPASSATHKQLPPAVSHVAHEPKAHHRASSILHPRRARRERKEHDATAAASSVTGGDSLRVPSLSGTAPPSIAISAAPGSARSATNLSLAPTATPSTASPPASSASSPSASAPLSEALRSSARLRSLLGQVWLACAASFRRAGRVEESRGAVMEAEGVLSYAGGRGEEDGEQGKKELAGVWSQLALLHLLLTPLTPLPAREALSKALAFDPSHLPSLVLLSRLYLSPPPPMPVGAAPPPPASHLTFSAPSSSPPTAAGAAKDANLHLTLPLAEALLTSLTQHQGNSSPEAWYELSRCYALTGRKEKEREALLKALGLEESRGVREVEGALGGVAV